MSDLGGADGIVISLEGIFDVEAARRLADTLADAGPEREVYVDLGHVREFNDCGIAVLAQALRESPARVSLRGLRQHQHRMLRYLGVGGRALEENTADSIYRVRDMDELPPFD